MASPRAEFEAVFQKLVDELCENVKEYKLPENAVDWYRTVNRHFLQAQSSANVQLLSPFFIIPKAVNTTGGRQ